MSEGAVADNGGRRLRIGSILIQPILVWDDGDELSPGPFVQEMRLPLREARRTLEHLPREVGDLETQLSGADGEASPPPPPS